MIRCILINSGINILYLFIIQKSMNKCYDIRNYEVLGVIAMNHITSTGIKGIDSVLYGGFPKGSSIIVEGSPGTGKTTLGVQFLYYGAVELNEPGIYITFEEFPQQIYQEMLSFGWDLRKLERQNLLRVISIKPDVLYKQMKTQDGLFEQIIKEINCRRIVVDSISLFQYLYTNPIEIRETLYNLRNIFRKHSLTALLLSEQSRFNGEQSFEHYIFDGVIHLALKEYMYNYRKRTLEITKMRGCKFIEGEHIYRITDRGIHLVPALTMVEDVVISSQDQLSTGIKTLDKLLSGGIPRGTSFMLDTNSKANFKYLVGAIIASRLLEGDRMIVISSNVNTVLEQQRILALYGVNLEEVGKRKGIFFLEHYQRHIPSAFKDLTFDVKDLDNNQYQNFLNDTLAPMVYEGLKNGESWFIYYDLNTIFSQRGAEFVKQIFTRETAWARASGITLFTLCNFAEVGSEISSFLERTTNTVIRTWVDSIYQYLQVTKSTNGRISEPYIVETISDKPYIQLV